MEHKLHSNCIIFMYKFIYKINNTSINFIRYTKIFLIGLKSITTLCIDLRNQNLISAQTFKYSNFVNKVSANTDWARERQVRPYLNLIYIIFSSYYYIYFWISPYFKLMFLSAYSTRN